MVGSGTANLAFSISDSTGVQGKPVRPVATELEEVIEVHQSILLQRIDQIGEQVVGRERPEHHQPFSDAKFLVSQIESRIDSASDQTRSVKCFLTNQHSWLTGLYLQRHN